MQETVSRIIKRLYSCVLCTRGR